MEQKTLSLNKFMPLLFNSLKNKKNWFLISAAIIGVTSILIPYLVKELEFFALFGVMEAFAILFLNCLIDNSFLHNDSKLAYYKSKPVSLRKQIGVNIASNMIFAGFLLLILLYPMMNIDANVVEIYSSMIPWMIIGIFVTALSSILTGNTIVAGITSIFNFALPALFYLIMRFIFTILEDLVVGFSADVLSNTLVNKFYNLYEIYFINYMSYNNSAIGITYILMFAAMIIGLSIGIIVNINRRKNEDTGNFIVSEGYKYFVAVFASLLVPALFSAIYYGIAVKSKMIAFLIMAVLSYYVIISILEKSFRISKLSIKLFLCFIVIFVGITGSTVVIADNFKDYVPNPDDVESAYIGENVWTLYNQIDNDKLDATDPYEIRRQLGATIFKEKQNIKSVTDIHREFLSNQNYYTEVYIDKVAIAYLMKDGKVIIRDYTLKDRDNSENTGNAMKNALAKELINSQEFKILKYYYLYDDKISKTIKINIMDDNRREINVNISNEELIEAIKTDMDNILSESDNCFDDIFNNYSSYNGLEGEYLYDLEITIPIYTNDEKINQDIYESILISGKFKTTMNLIKSKIIK